MTRKEALLLAAKQVFGECGFNDATFKKISERAGVALGLLSHHYGNKEKLFHAAGVDVLNHFIEVLGKSVVDQPNGLAGVESFCRAYLAFTLDPDSHWLVLVRCSPYSDMKAGPDRDQMFEHFAKVHLLLEEQLVRGMEDGSMRQIALHETSQILVAMMVGVNRTQLLTPYAGSSPALYQEALAFAMRALKACKE